MKNSRDLLHSNTYIVNTTVMNILKWFKILKIKVFLKGLEL